MQSSKVHELEELAHSHSVFDSVGKLELLSEKPNITATFTHDSIRGFSGSVTYMNNGVYIGDNLVLTSATSVPSFVKDGEFIDNLTQHWYFFTKSKNKLSQGFRVIRAIRHPVFNTNAKFILRDQMQYNIAVLLIFDENINIQAAKINYKSFTVRHNVTAVGLPLGYVIRCEDNKRYIDHEFVPKTDRTKIAISLPSTYISGNALTNVIGYDVKVKKHKVQSRQRPYDYQESGIGNAMSGGGWFANRKLIGISTGLALKHTDAYNNPDDCPFSSIAGDTNFAVPLFRNKKWLQKTIKTLKEDRQRFKDAAKSWFDSRYEYEFKRSCQTDDKMEYSSKVFEDLANGQPLFENVGRLENFSDEDPSDFIIATIPNSIEIKQTTISKMGSAVYIGNQLVLTAAHCVPDYVNNGVFIDGLKNHWYFFTTDTTNTTSISRVIAAIRHPDYKGSKDRTCQRTEGNDISILLLESKLKHHKGIEIDYMTDKIKTGLVSIGFPCRSLIPKLSTNKRVVTKPKELVFRKKQAIRIPNVYIRESIFKHTLGYAVNVSDSKINNVTDLKEQPYDPLENSVSGGMSGGALMQGNKLVGITMSESLSYGSYHPLIAQNPNVFFSKISGDLSWFTPLFKHQKWLETAKESLLSQLPKFTEQLEDWYRKRKTYEEDYKKKNSSVLMKK